MKCKNKVLNPFGKSPYGFVITYISWTLEVIIEKIVAGLCLARSRLVRGRGCRKGQAMAQGLDKLSQT